MGGRNRGISIALAFITVCTTIQAVINILLSRIGTSVKPDKPSQIQVEQQIQI